MIIKKCRHNFGRLNPSTAPDYGPALGDPKMRATHSLTALTLRLYVFVAMQGEAEHSVCVGGESMAGSSTAGGRIVDRRRSP